MTDSIRPLTVSFPRIQWMDTAKGIGIVLVVVGHMVDPSPPIETGLCRFIYLFHMPLFFILAGCLMNAQKTGVIIRKKTMSLLVPYIAYLSLLGIPLVLSTDAIHSSQWHLLPVDIFHLLLGGPWMAPQLGVFWFVTCLFFSQVIFNGFLLVCDKPFNPKMLILVTLCAMLAYSLFLLPGPLDIGVAPFAVLMLWAGFSYRRFSDRAPAVSLISLAAILICLLVERHGHFNMDLKHGNLGPPITGAVMAISLSFLFIELCKLLQRTNGVLAAACQKLGRASLTIMFLQKVMLGAAQHAHLPRMVGVVVAIIAPLAIHEGLSRFRLTRVVFLGHPDSPTKPAAAALPNYTSEPAVAD